MLTIFLTVAFCILFFICFYHVTLPQDQTICTRGLGMEDMTIEDFQIEASSSQPAYPVQNARLNNRFGWCAAQSDQNPYLQVSGQ